VFERGDDHFLDKFDCGSPILPVLEVEPDGRCILLQFRAPTIAVCLGADAPVRRRHQQFVGLSWVGHCHDAICAELATNLLAKVGIPVGGFDVNAPTEDDAVVPVDEAEVGFY
jgi:hypothetical protein